MNASHCSPATPNFLIQIRLILAVAALTACTAQGASGTWTGLSVTDSNWGSAANWTGASAPGATETATFLDGGNGRVVLSVGNVTIRNINFETANVAAYTLGTAPGVGTLTINANGVISVDATVTNNQTVNSNISTSVGGGNFFTNNSTTAVLRVAGAVSLASGATANRVFSVNGAGSTVISGAISNGASAFTLGLTKSGAGALTLSGTNTYTGLTTVSAGTLIIDGDQSASTGAVAANAGTNLSGNGIIGGATTITNGTLAAGTISSVGNLSFSNNLTLVGASANAVFDIGGSARGVAGGYDAITLDPAASLIYAGALTLNITSLLPTGTFDLFSFGAGLDSGGFTSVAITGGIYTGYSFSQTAPGNGIWVASNGGNTFTFSETTGDLSLVPEPATWSLLLGFAMLALVLRRSGRRHSA